MVSTGMNPYINAQGYALVGMVAVGAGAIANLILDPILIFACGMGIRGAAAATVISQFLSFVLVMHFLLGKKNDYPVRFAWSFPYAGNIIGLGISPFIMQVTNSLVQIVCNNVLMHFGGVLFVSVMTIISSVRSILDVPALAVTEGASPVISYNYGAGKALNTRKAIRIMICMVVPYTFVIWLLVLGFPGWFIRIFSADEALLEPGKHALHLYFAAFVFQSLQYSGQMVFKALNKKKQTIFFSLLLRSPSVSKFCTEWQWFNGYGITPVLIDSHSRRNGTHNAFLLSRSDILIDQNSDICPPDRSRRSNCLLLFFVYLIILGRFLLGIIGICIIFNSHITRYIGLSTGWSSRIVGGAVVRFIYDLFTTNNTGFIHYRSECLFISLTLVKIQFYINPGIGAAFAQSLIQQGLNILLHTLLNLAGHFQLGHGLHAYIMFFIIIRIV